MLAYFGSGSHDDRCAAEVPVISGHGDGAGQEVVHFHHGAPFPGVRVLRRVGDVVHRRGDDVVSTEVVDGLIHGHIRQQGVDGVVHLVPVLGPFVASGEPGVFQPLRLAQSITHPVPVVLVAGGQEDMPPFAGVGPAGRRPGASALGSYLGAVISGYGDLGHAVTGISQTNVDRLPLSRQLPFVQCGERSYGRVQGRHTVDDRHSGQDGRVSLLSGNHGDPRHGLSYGIVADVFPVWSELAERGDVNHDHPGVQLF